MTLQAVPTGADLLQFLGWPSDAQVLAQANIHVEHFVTLAREHTRGVGFDSEASGGVLAQGGICKAILTAAARSLSNPEQARRVEAGSFSALPGVADSWALLERLTLDRYRRRFA